MSLHSICSLLLFLAIRASGIDCGTSSEQIVAPLVVGDTAGATQLAEALYCGGSFSVEWLGFVTLEAPIIVYENSTLNVKGAEDGSSWVDGADQHQLFQVTNGTLNLYGLNLIRGNYSYGGSILALDSNVSVEKCSFVGNKATLYGGAIDVVESYIGLTNCSFYENNAMFGGAIDIWSSTLVLGNSTFGSTSVENSQGGASFDANSTGFYGGAIFAFDSDVSIASCTFFENNAIFSGGAIAVFASNTSMFNCSFNDNIATIGGAISLSSSNLVLGDSSFFGNSAEDTASNIYDTNITTFHGGAIFASYSVIGAFNCSFFGNIANFGGALCLEFTTAMLGDASFHKNIAGQSGGAIYSPFFTAIIVNGNAVWEANESILGGAIRLYYYSTLEILGNAGFSRNSAAQGGGIWLSEGSSINIFGSASFDENKALIGGAINLQDGTIANFSGEVLMMGNTASSSGGAMYCQATKSIGVYNTRFVSNFAGANGGAISVGSAGPEDLPSKFSLCSFENNTAGDAGGAIHTSGGFVSIHGSNFTGNIAGEESLMRIQLIYIELFPPTRVL